MTEPHIPAELRRLVISRATACCEYCLTQEKFSPQSLSIDHIVPRKLGGTTTADNLALSCQGCNSHKSARTVSVDPLTTQEVPLFNPCLHPWNDHFAWSADFTVIVGQTPVGRATVEALLLNRRGLVNLRRVLYATGEHPPDFSH